MSDTPHTYYEVWQMERYGNFLPDAEPDEPDADEDMFQRNLMTWQ